MYRLGGCEGAKAMVTLLLHACDENRAMPPGVNAILGRQQTSSMFFPLHSPNCTSITSSYSLSQHRTGAMPVVAGTKSSDRDACRGVAAKLEACLIAVDHDPTQCQAEIEVVARCCEKYWVRHCTSWLIKAFSRLGAAGL